MPQPPHPANVPRGEYTPAEVEFILAMERYKREANRPFPAWHEVLRVVKGLGYRKVDLAPGLPGETDAPGTNTEDPRQAGG
jgi:hypothetical protein